MNIRSKKFALVAAITFIILFLMNYLGNNEADKLQNALMIAGAGVIGLTLGFAFIYPKKGDHDQHPDID